MRMVAALSGKGGVGKTTTVANLGVTLSLMGQRVAVVDCNFVNPDLRFHFGVYAFDATLHDVLAGTISLETALIQHPSGVSLLPCLASVPEWPLTRLREGLRDLRADFVLLDTYPGIENGNGELLGMCDEALLVTNADLVTWTDTKRIARQVGLPLRWVINRQKDGSMGGVAPPEAPWAAIPEWPEAERYLLKGTPYALEHPEGAAAQQYARLAGDMVEAAARGEVERSLARFERYTSQGAFSTRLLSILRRFKEERLREKSHRPARV
ncbi:MAG: AAA family ATPase [Euryarchaeota archaeon]|nr:AAA family ATPase [Euryarchaeota archaeon]